MRRGKADVPQYRSAVLLNYDTTAFAESRDIRTDQRQLLLPVNELVPEEQRLARRILVMDEFGDLTFDPKISKEFCYGVQRFGAKARAAGIHVILATQRPDQKTVPSVLKSNLGAKVALRVASAVNSRGILDQGGAEQLLGSGDFLADLGRGILHGQAAVVAVQVREPAVSGISAIHSARLFSVMRESGSTKPH